jgi:hypothetical protein
MTTLDREMRSNPMKRREGLLTIWQDFDIEPDQVPEGGWKGAPEWEKRATEFEGAVPAFKVEKPMFTCAHCSTMVVKNPDRARPHDTCKRCDKYLCRACDYGDKELGVECVPREKRAELAQKYPELGLPFMDSGPRGEKLFPSELLDEKRLF